MKSVEFNDLLSQLNGLTDFEREKLTVVLQRVGGEEKVINMIESQI